MTLLRLFGEVGLWPFKTKAHPNLQRKAEGGHSVTLIVDTYFTDAKTGEPQHDHIEQRVWVNHDTLNLEYVGLKATIHVTDRTWQ